MLTFNQALMCLLNSAKNDEARPGLRAPSGLTSRASLAKR